MCLVSLSRAPGHRLWLLLALSPLPLLLVCGDVFNDNSVAQVAPGEATCLEPRDACQQGHIRSTSLLQLSTPVRRGSQGMDMPQLAVGEGAFWENELRSLEGGGDLGTLLRSATQLNQQQMTGGNAAASMNAQASDFMQETTDTVRSAQTSVASDAAKALQAAQALQDAHHDGQEAQAAQEMEAKHSAEAGKALEGAMQRVQRASEVEMQELAIEAEATRRLEEAAKNARQVQELEDEAAVREARAAELLRNAIRKLESKDHEDASPIKQVLKSIEAAQSSVEQIAEEASNKARASQLLQESLSGAATAVEALKAGKEAQTSRWLQDAFRELQWMHSSWNQRTEAEANVASHLDNAVKSSEKAEKLASGEAANKQSVLSLIDGVLQKVRTAQSMASREATTASLAQQAAEAREALKDRSLQDALRKLQAFEQGYPAMRMQTSPPSGMQLSTYLQGLLQNVKASSDAQQVQLAQVMQQVSQAMNTQPSSGLPPFPGVPAAPPYGAVPQLNPWTAP